MDTLGDDAGITLLDVAGCGVTVTFDIMLVVSTELVECTIFVGYIELGEDTEIVGSTSLELSGLLVEIIEGEGVTEIAWESKETRCN